MRYVIRMNTHRGTPINRGWYELCGVHREPRPREYRSEIMGATRTIRCEK